MLRSATVLVFLAAFAGLSQTRPAAKPANSPPSARAASAPARPGANDAAIERSIRARLAKSKIAADKFQFHVQGGIVTIEGRTDVIQHKGAATRMAKAAGAVAVVNHIQISQAAKDRAAARLAKGRQQTEQKNDTGGTSEPKRVAVKH